MLERLFSLGEAMAKKRKKAMKIRRRAWSKVELRELKDHSRAKTPVAKIAKQTRRTPGALRQQAFKMGLSLGHRR
jgi:hypothetical protein